MGFNKKHIHIIHIIHIHDIFYRVVHVFYPHVIHIFAGEGACNPKKAVAANPPRAAVVRLGHRGICRFERVIPYCGTLLAGWWFQT